MLKSGKVLNLIEIRTKIDSLREIFGSLKKNSFIYTDGDSKRLSAKNQLQSYLYSCCYDSHNIFKTLSILFYCVPSTKYTNDVTRILSWIYFPDCFLSIRPLRVSVLRVCVSGSPSVQIYQVHSPESRHYHQLIQHVQIINGRYEIPCLYRHC